MSIVVAGFILGLFGSLHCVAMCGPLAAGVAALPGSRWRPVRRSAAYLAGKTTTYAVIGGVAGGFGAVVLEIASSYQDGLSIALGTMLIATGAVMLVGTGRGAAIGAPYYRTLSSAMGRLMRERKSAPAFTLGALNGLLPCGLVLAAALVAAGTTSVLNGAIAMAAFGLGTVPALGAIMAGMGRLAGGRSSAHLAKGGAVLVIVVGLLTIARGTDLMDMVMPHDHSDSVEHVHGHIHHN